MQASPTGFHRFAQDIEYYEEHRDELLQQYPEMWIAIFEQAVVGEDRDLDHLLAALKAQGVPPEHALIKYMRRDEDLLILSS